jgi:hypothetical protein
LIRAAKIKLGGNNKIWRSRNVISKKQWVFLCKGCTLLVKIITININAVELGRDRFNIYQILKRGGLGYDCYLVYFIKHLGLRFNITFKKQE